MKPEMNPFDLEKDLISPNLWNVLYPKLPKKCQEIITEPLGVSTGIGFNNKLGWFILCTAGQGPILYWSENET